MAMLFKSRKFGLMIFDVVISTATFFITKYVAPEMAENILWLIGSWQPVVISVIIGIAVEDSARFHGDAVITAAEISVPENNAPTK